MKVEDLSKLSPGERYYTTDLKNRLIVEEVLLNTGEMVSGVIICEYKGTVNRIVYKEGGKYIGIGVIHA